jgi:isocitrate dehydrogenase kinase/phosphatase
MDISTVENVLAQRIAEAMIDGFNRHYRLIRPMASKPSCCSRRLTGRASMTPFVSVSAPTTTGSARPPKLLCANFGAASLDDATWQQLKLFYIGQLINHKQPELAETFLQLGVLEDPAPDLLQQRLHLCPSGRVDRIHPVLPADLSQLLPGAARPAQHHPADHRRFRLATPFEDLDRDVGYIMRTAEQAPRRVAGGRGQRADPGSALGFYRNKGAYIFGKAINGHHEVPFAIAVLHTPKASWCSTRSCSTAG